MIAAKVILFFWAFYFSIVFITNSFDVPKHFGIMPKWWKLTSGNYNFLVRVNSAYKLTSRSLMPMFIGVILIELAAAIYFWKVIVSPPVEISVSVYIPFSISLFMFGGFVILDEVFFSFLAEENHFRIFIALIVSLIFVRYFIG